ncbi:transcriptional regulator with XRE-family HTH domain [Micrococcus endophyticus]|uniref:Transcriptional regulator with XRE-family HTH domain n=2 Tax=Micrococcus TaxID=1269 RepID=A0A7W9N1G1_9MICC|nr:transcriptional regulator with XRE-family HTH domain [Micrococcus endophyticus]MCK6091032.1 helix-turn-helix domain-containing protein [Micrococcus endophyticus]
MSDEHLEQQRTLYGAPLAERFTGVREAYGLSQRALAQTLGLSAPMLSQLASGQRIKIGSPAVYARLVMLEERAGEPDPAAVLAEVRDSEPVLTSQSFAASPEADLPARLARLAGPAGLRAAESAARAAGEARLADVLAAAAEAGARG